MEARVLVVGSANMDLVVAARRRPGAGETVLGGDTVAHPGGKGANAAVAAARLGAEVALLGAVGADEHGRHLLAALDRSGVDISPVRHVHDRPTGMAYITVTPDGENSILVSPGANEALRPADVDEALPGAQLMVVSMEIPLDTVEHALRAAARAGVPTVLNLSPVAGLSGAALGAVDVLLVNEHEAAWLLGSGAGDRAPGSPEHHGDDPGELLDLGPRTAVVTSGASGARVLTSARDTRVPAVPVEPVDTTGAGDAFAGALATALAGGGPPSHTAPAGPGLPAGPALPEFTAPPETTVSDPDAPFGPERLLDAVGVAVRVAGTSVTRAGAQPSYPTLSELSSAN